MDKVRKFNILDNMLEEFIKENYSSFDECVMDLFFSNFINIDDLSLIKTDGYGDAGIDYMFFTCNKNQFFELSDLDEVKTNERIDIYLVQIKNTDELDSNVPNKFIEYSTHIFDNEDLPSHYNEEVKNSLKLIRDIIIKYSLKNSVSLHFYYINRVSQNVIDKSTDLNGRFNSLKNMFTQYIPSALKDVSYEILSLDRIVEQSRESNIYEYTFSEVECFKGALDKNKKLGVIGLIPIKQYYEFIVDSNNEINEKLFESNIRDFKGKSSVNSDISRTLNDEDSLDFWWLNNGITMTCEELVSGDVQRQIYVKNPQIVNGLQTSYSIYNYYKANPEKLKNETRKIFVKLLKFDEDIDDKELDVIISTNRQNEIRDKDIHANDSVQQTIEKYFLTKGKYYQRKDKYYTNRRLPKKDIVRLAEMAKYINTIFLKDPSSTRNNPGKLVVGNKYNVIFQINNSEQDYNRYWIAQSIYSKIMDLNKGSIEINNDLFDKANFIHHIVYICLVLITCNIDYTPQDVLQIKTEYITNSFIENCYAILINIVSENQIANSKILKSIKEASMNKKINDYLINYIEMHECIVENEAFVMNELNIE